MDVKKIHKYFPSLTGPGNRPDNGRHRFKHGFSLIETLVALALFASITVVFISALNTTSRNTGIIDEHTTARNLAATFIETMRNENFAEDYSSVTDAIARPSQYDVEIELKYSGDGGDTWSDNFSANDLQRITVYVKRGGRLVLSFCGYKMDL